MSRAKLGLSPPYRRYSSTSFLQRKRWCIYYDDYDVIGAQRYNALTQKFTFWGIYQAMVARRLGFEQARAPLSQADR